LNFCATKYRMTAERNASRLRQIIVVRIVELINDYVFSVKVKLLSIFFRLR